MVQSANRIANVEEYYFSKKLAEVRGLDTPELRVIMAIRIIKAFPHYVRVLLIFQNVHMEQH
jgi:hypothetical protein